VKSLNCLRLDGQEALQLHKGQAGGTRAFWNFVFSEFIEVGCFQSHFSQDCLQMLQCSRV
jgi:hypothetical protein